MGKCALNALRLLEGLLADGFPLPDGYGGDRAKTQDTEDFSYPLITRLLCGSGLLYRGLSSGGWNIVVRRRTHRHDFERTVNGTTTRGGRFQGFAITTASQMLNNWRLRRTDVRKQLCSNLQSFGSIVQYDGSYFVYSLSCLFVY